MSSAATLFQRNKQIYVEEETKLESVVCDTTYIQSFQNWLDTTVSQLDFLFGRCEQQLSELQQKVAVQGGSFWTSKHIIEYCNLHLSEKRLTTKGKTLDEKGEYAPLPDLVNLITVLQQVKSHSFVTPKQKRFVEQCEEELKNVVFEPQDLVFITNALQTKLRDDVSARGIFGDLAAFQNTIEELSPDIDQCEQLLEASIANGEMGLAEDISKRQLDIYEHVLRLITDQYPIISNHHAETRQSDRRRRWAIFRMASRDINAVIEGKYRAVEACEEDLTKIKEQVENYNADDLQQRKRYEEDRGASDRFLDENKGRQQGVWNKVFQLFQELQGCSEELSELARTRRREVDRRLQVEEREAGRRSGHEAFLQAAADHAKKLEDTIENALTARDIALALNNFVLDGCDSISERYDQQQRGMSDMLRVVQEHHLQRFTDYYIAASRYLYRKQRRLAQLDEQMLENDMQRELLIDQLDPKAKTYAEANEKLIAKRRDVAQEVLYIKHKLEKAEKVVEPTLRSLEYAGVRYVHPRGIVEQMNANRWSTILDYREVMNPSVSKMEKELVEESVSLRRAAAKLESEGNVLNEEGTAIVDPSRNVVNSQRHLPKGTSASVRRQETARATEGTGEGPEEAGGALAAVVTAPAQSAFARRVQRMLDQQYSATMPPLIAGGGAPSPSPGPAAAAATTGGKASGGPTTLPRLSFGGSGKNKSVAALGGAGATTAGADGGAGDRGGGRGGGKRAMVDGVSFRALYHYKARAPDELSFEQGDLIVCVGAAQEEGWFRGICNQRTGLFPINYVEPAEDTF